MTIQPVILCGGAGSRLWPLSREQYPKQLLQLIDSRSLLQSTLLRLTKSSDFSSKPPILIGNAEYRFILAEQLRALDISDATVVLEPVGRNTAPALTLGALAAVADGDDPVMIVMPSDHVVVDGAAFNHAVCTGLPFAHAGQIVTLGVECTAPETGYGYILRGTPLSDGKSFSVVEFIEKPDALTAEKYFESGQFYWNSGIFLIRASVWLSKIREFQPSIASACEVAFSSRQIDLDFLRPNQKSFETCPSDSIDYAVIEHLATRHNNTGEVVVVPLNAGWSDVGAWGAVWDVNEKTNEGNVFRGDVVAKGMINSLVMSQSRLVACIGLEDAVVIETADAVLVASRHHIQQVKDVVSLLNARGRREAVSSRKVHRPWGWYDSIDSGERFQVKRIVVNPGASLSLQMHHHRAEHWIVVQGTARVTRGTDIYLVTENQSTYIPLGEKHRLDNPGKIPLEMIEVQSGGYLGEDDIVRFDDIYGR